MKPKMQEAECHVCDETFFYDPDSFDPEIDECICAECEREENDKWAETEHGFDIHAEGKIP